MLHSICRCARVGSAALLLLACAEDGAAPFSDAGGTGLPTSSDGSSISVEAAPDAAANRDASGRAFDTFNSATCPAASRACQPAISFGLYPVYAIDPIPAVDIPKRLTLHVLDRGPVIQSRSAGAPYTNDVSLLVQSQLGPVGKEQLWLSASAPWALRSDAIPDTLIYESSSLIGGCPRRTKGVSAFGGVRVSDSAGALLTANSGLLLGPGGSVRLPDDLTLPFHLRWVDAGCGRCSADQGTVAIELTLEGQGSALGRVLPGEALNVSVGGIDYVFRTGIPSFDYATQCGETGFSFYRKDLVKALNEDGTLRDLDPLAVWSSAPP